MRQFLKLSLIALLGLAGCETHVVIEQPKPLDINLNITGNFHLVIEDARQNLAEINGAKPATIVRPEDIGLPADTKPGAAVREGGSLYVAEDGFEKMRGETVAVLFRAGAGAGGGLVVQVAALDDVKKAMAARYAKVQALWDSKLAGESHTGLMVAKGVLSAEQQKLMTDENADRTTLYAADAKSKGTTVDEVVLGYYLARLGYAKTGDWYEEVNKTTKKWEWVQKSK